LLGVVGHHGRYPHSDLLGRMAGLGRSRLLRLRNINIYATVQPSPVTSVPPDIYEQRGSK
jgi:hypothetical protein